jgi:trypsin-like peptidase
VINTTSRFMPWAITHWMNSNTKHFLLAGGFLLTFATACVLVGWPFAAAFYQRSTADYQTRLGATERTVSVPDDSLQIYAVNVVHAAPFKHPFIGYGIYLGSGKIITAAHVVGHWPLFKNLRVLIAGLDLPAEVIKQSDFDDADLALLSVDESRLPISLQLRRNAACREPLVPGADVAIVLPESTMRSQILSPQFIAAPYRARFSSLTKDLGHSGSGVFGVQKKCLLGIMSRKIPKVSYQKEGRNIVVRSDGFAGYFVPVFDFIPPEFRF